MCVVPRALTILRSSAKARCAECTTSSCDILGTLNELLEHQNRRVMVCKLVVTYRQVRTYVNGTLYSVLEVEEMKERANALGMEDILKYLIHSSDEEFRQQLEFILDKLQSGNSGLLQN